MTTKFLAILLVAGLSTSASAQRHWKEIGKTSVGNSVYVDPSSVKTVKGIVTARIRVKFTKPVETPQGAWKSSQHIAMFNCARSTVAAKETVYYADDAGTKVIERKVVGIPGFGSPIGGSMTRVALDYFCRK
jgi:hypothetical protein